MRERSTTHRAYLRLRFLAVAAFYAVALVLAVGVGRVPADSPAFVLTAMICFLGLAFVAGPLVRIRVPRPVRPVRAWEERWYPRLGVHVFGRMLRRTPLRALNTQVYLRASGGDVSRLVAALEQAEASHAWAALLVAPYMVLLAARGEWGSLAVVTVVQVLGNVYPVCHLRVARRRIELRAQNQERLLPADGEPSSHPAISERARPSGSRGRTSRPSGRGRS